MMSARHKIEKGRFIEFSAQDVLNCQRKCQGRDSMSCVADLGCDGGEPAGALMYGQMFGFVPASCVGYVGRQQKCSCACDDGSPKTRYMLGEAYQLLDSWASYKERARNIMTEIYLNGPITVHHTAYQDFYNYEGGIYHETEGRGADRGGHAVMSVRLGARR